MDAPLLHLCINQHKRKRMYDFIKVSDIRLIIFAGTPRIPKNPRVPPDVDIPNQAPSWDKLATSIPYRTDKPVTKGWEVLWYDAYLPGVKGNCSHLSNFNRWLCIRIGNKWASTLPGKLSSNTAIADAILLVPFPCSGTDNHTLLPKRRNSTRLPSNTHNSMQPMNHCRLQ